MTIQKRRLPIDESPHDNIHKGSLASKQRRSRINTNKTPTNAHITVRMDAHTVTCKICKESQSIPISHDYKGTVKPVVDNFKEKHNHQ